MMMSRFTSNCLLVALLQFALSWDRTGLERVCSKAVTYLAASPFKFDCRAFKE